MMSPNNSLDPGQGRAHAHARPSLDDQSHGTNDAIGVASGLRPDGYPTRNHSQGVVASHFLAHGGEEETWLQFLRHGSPPRADRRQSSSPSNYTHTSRPSRPFPRTDSSSSTSADRKRRLTTADSPMRRPSSIRMHSDNAGDTRTDPIVLESSPLPERPLPPPPPGEVARADTGSLSRRQSDIVLPPWQPDSEVAQCPVCGRHFTFLYRKHHCRKCGRVVCSSCSPHRITIPRQFIVHPPYDTLSNFVDLTGDDDNNMSSFGPFRNPALGGGEEVRVCNPCVPDPNYNPPPQYTTALPSRRSSRPALPPYVPAAPPPRHRSTSSIHNAPQTIGHGQTMRARDPFSTSHNNDTRRMSYHGGSSTAAERWLPPLPGAASQQYVTHHDSRPIPGAAHHSSSSGAVYSRSFLQTYMPPALHPSQPQTPRPARRQIAEEDECPICGNELPPKGPDNDESARDQHVEECIALHSAASVAPASLTQQTSASLPNQRTRGMSSAGDAVGEGGPSSNANRMSHAARGMFSYIATEKDCVDDDGGEAECIICLEDFEAGEKMARLVCWCKFHEKCIKEWWDKKGRGACPTHQLQE